MRAAQLLSLLALGAGGLFSAACGDGPQCPSELVLVIQSPSDGASVAAAADSDPNSAGLQTDVEVRSNFSSGAELTLSVTEGASGAVAQHTAIVNGDGDATFTNVTLPGGSVTLDVDGSSKCGLASDSSTISVITDGACSLTIDEGPIANDFYAPIPVLNTTNDSNLTLANFQANVTVAAAPGFSVEFFVLDVNAGSEASIGTMTADANGEAKFATTLAQGRQILRATCSLGAISAASGPSTVQVDTVAPTCTLTNPAVGVTVTPDDDDDSGSDGIQMTWTGTANAAGEGDIAGEDASFFRDTTEFVGSALDASGNSSTAGEFTAPGAYELAFNSQDHAGNLCSGGFTANVVMDGCAIAIEQPSGAGTTGGIVTADSDGVGPNGLQADLTVQVGTECAGQTVFINCGQGETSAVAPGNGTTVISDVTLNPLASSQGNAACTARVTNADNFQTSNQATIPYDTQAPGGNLEFIFPNTVSCGDILIRDVANDSTGTLGDGFQIEMRAVSALAVERDIAVTNATCTAPCITSVPTFPATVDILLANGSNDIRALTRDAVGNEATTPECIVRLEDIAVDIVDPVGTGLLGANSPGVTVNGGNAETTVCATTSRNDVDVTLEIVSGAGTTTEPMTFNAGLGQFCTGIIAFPEGDYQLTATAIEMGAGTLQGTDIVNLTVDLTAPILPGGFTFNASSPNHRDIDADWDAVAGVDHYVLRFSTTAFTADFANEGTEVPGVGTSTSFTIGTLNAGVSYFVGVALADAAGNLSDASTLGGVIPIFDPTGAIEPPTLATASGVARRFGQSVVRGNFNNDEFGDIAVSAPTNSVGANDVVGEVYIYFGSANGIGSTPDVTIAGPGPVSAFGWSMARINWSTGAGDGLAISAPFVDQIYVFHGATLSSGDPAQDTSDADIRIVVNSTANWFTNGLVGWSLAAGQLNTGAEDLIIGVPSGNGGVGGAAVIYGRAAVGDQTITLSQTANATAMAGFEAVIFQNPVVAANGSSLGYSVAYLGDTRLGDGAGDAAIAYFSDHAPNILQDNAVYVLRGRAVSGTAGMSFTTLKASDLRIENPTTETSTSFGMELGSISGQGTDDFRDIVISAHQEGLGTLWIVDGSLTGTVVLNDDTDYLTKITGTSDLGFHFASSVVNGADAIGLDVNGNDGDDLVVAGGRPGSTTGVSLFIWYDADIPVGDATSASANATISAPAEFTSNAFGGQPNTLQATWAGDVNNDGLPDLCWADWQAGVGAEVEGRFEVLWDDPAN